MSLFTKLFTLFYITTTIHASVYDNDTLNIFSKIIPRMVLMSSQKQQIKESIDICVTSDKMDEDAALSLIDKIQSSYPNGLTNRPLKLINTSYSSMEKCQHSQLVFLLDSNDKNIQKALQYAHDHTALTMSYDPKYLDHGVDISLFFGRKVTPYLNIGALRKDGIEIDNLLIRISKIYLYEDKK